MTPLGRHQIEIHANRLAWERKPLLREIYAGFYRRILEWIDPQRPGRIVELGSGIGNLKAHLPGALCSDLFPNPWLDLVCDGYELPFPDASLSHVVMFDVFHHVEAPAALLAEARRALSPEGRLILFEPYISAASYPVYGWLHHEPVAWRSPISMRDRPPPDRGYYAAQGNATRLFFQPSRPCPFPQWRTVHASAFSAFHYLLSGGYGRRAWFPRAVSPLLRRLDRELSRWPRLFGARCLIVLAPAAPESQPEAGVGPRLPLQPEAHSPARLAS